MTKIFISHSSKDNEFARQLAQALAEVGINVWIDLADIPAGMKWSTAVQQGLKECDVMIVVLSPDAVASVNVEDEWQYYFDTKKKVFPVRWQLADVHFQLRRIQYIDFHEKEFAGAFEHLCAELKRNGIAVNGSDGQMHEIQSESATPAPPRLQRGVQIVSDVEDSPLLPPSPDHTPDNALSLMPFLEGRTTKLPYISRVEDQPLPLSPIDTPKKTLSRVEDILPPPFEWINIPAGKVMLEAGGYLKKPTMFDGPAFAIAKYPVTNAQFAKFIEAGGYQEKRWWTPKGWQIREDGMNREKQFDSWEPVGESWTEPALWQNIHSDRADYPVIGVSWYEANAFCKWLSEASSKRVNLPTEHQWQRAAQGDDGRIYPWGNEFDKDKCNTRQSGIGHTTPVTEYLQGASPYGVIDMSGNVWEWCLTDWDSGNPSSYSPFYDIGISCLRGASWMNLAEDARTLYRYSSKPSARHPAFGFRLCLSSQMRHV